MEGTPLADAHDDTRRKQHLRTAIRPRGVRCLKECLQTFLEKLQRTIVRVNSAFEQMNYSRASRDYQLPVSRKRQKGE